MTALVRHQDVQAEDTRQVSNMAEAVQQREGRLKVVLTVVLSVNLALVFGAMTLVALLAKN